MDILAHGNTKATFFVLGWIAERFPNLIKDIAKDKHEIALHGYDHQLVTNLAPSDFLRDITVAKAIVEDVVGDRITGYRAPSFSINKNTSWALAIIRSQGFKYDSSIFPLGIFKYDFRSIPSKPFEIMPGLMEIPLPVIRCAGINLPFGGGVFLRVYPYAFNRWAIRRLNVRGNAPAVVYIHPWEIDPDQPRPCPLTLPVRLRHYTNLGQFEQRFRMLIKDFSFCPLREIIKA